MSKVESDPEQKNLKPIPLSPRVVWQTVRMRVVPPVLLLVLVGAICWQWMQMNPGGVPGLAEGARSVVSCPQHAYIAEIKVRPYEFVQAGDPLVVLRPADPRSKLDLLQSELQIARLNLEPSIADRNALNYERLRVEQLRLKEELAISQIDLQRAESALRRSNQLLRDKLISEDAHEIAVRDRDSFTAEVTEKKAALAQIQERLEALRGFAETGTGTNSLDLHASELAERLKAATADMTAVTVVAPISGMVHGIGRAAGDFVAQGEPLLAVYSPRSERVIAYLRQPYPMDPQVGMKVEILTKSYRRQKFLAEITQVGAQLETITNALAVIKPGALVDMGLPIVVNVPSEVVIRPGETVDISFLKTAGSGLRLRVRSQAGL